MSMAFLVSRSPLVVLHKACKSNGNSSLDQRLDKLVISPEDKFELQLLRSSHAYQIGSLQIYQSDWYLQQRKDADLVLQKQLPYTAASYGYHTNVAISGMDSQLLKYSLFLPDVVTMVASVPLISTTSPSIQARSGSSAQTWDPTIMFTGVP